jgi:hypothetical protein
MVKGVNMTKVSIVGLVLVAMFLIAGIVLDAVGQSAQGQQAIATAVGVAVGTGATSVTIIQDVSAKMRGDSSGDKPAP